MPSTSTTIQEPHVAATYPLSGTSSRAAGRLPHVSATHFASAQRDDITEGYATVTVESNGIHIVDVSNVCNIRNHTEAELFYNLALFISSR